MSAADNPCIDLARQVDVVGVAAASPDEPFVLDMATSVIAEGKVRVAVNRGTPLKPQLIIDGDGQPTTPLLLWADSRARAARALRRERDLVAGGRRLLRGLPHRLARALGLLLRPVGAVRRLGVEAVADAEVGVDVGVFR